MPDRPAIEMLNKLLDAEQASFIQRLGEVCPFVAPSEASDHALLGRLVAAAADRRRDLVEFILQLRGAPVTPRSAPDTTSSHYVGLSFLMPRVIDAQRRLVAAYESAGPSGSSAVDALIGRHLADLRRHLAELEKLGPACRP